MKIGRLSFRMQIIIFCVFYNFQGACKKDMARNGLLVSSRSGINDDVRRQNGSHRGGVITL